MHVGRLTAVALFLTATFIRAQDDSPARRLRNLNNRVLRLHAEAEQTNGPSVIRDTARAAIKERSAVLAALIEQDPAQAVSFAFSPELVAELTQKFPDAASRLEVWSTWRGPIEYWIIDKVDGKHRSLIQMHTGAQTINIHFSGPEPHGLRSGDVLQVSGLLVGNTLAVSSATWEAASSNPADAVASTVSTNTVGASCSTTGVQNTAVLLVTFPDTMPPPAVTSQNIYDIFFGSSGPSLDGFWREASYGQTSAAGDVYGWYTLPGSYSCSNITQFVTDAVSAAAASGVNFNNYNRVFVVFPDMSPSCGWSGLSSVGCQSMSTTSGTVTVSTSTLVWNSMTTVGQGVPVIAHEGGHQLGLAHARLREFGTEPLGALGSSGTLLEYGDHFSAMGYPNLGHYAAEQKAELLNWLSSGTNYQVIQSSGRYTLQPYESSAGGLNALKIQRGTGNNAWLWAEYRQPIGIYDSTLNPQVFTGALIHYADSITSPQTDLLDFTAPNTYSDDPALAAGQTWNDPYSNLSLTVVSGTLTGLILDVNYGSASCTLAKPTLTATPSNPSIYAGNSATYTLSVMDNDSSGCSSSTFTLGSSQPSGWLTSLSMTSVTLSPGQVASLTMTKTAPVWTQPGTYPVDASATNGAYVGSVTANVTVMSAPTMGVTVSVPSSAYSRRSTIPITATVANGSTPVSGASVKFTLTRADGSTITQTARTGSNGTATWNFKVNQKSPTGTYSVAAVANLGTQTATGNKVTFTVQ